MRVVSCDFDISHMKQDPNDGIDCSVERVVGLQISLFLMKIPINIAVFLDKRRGFVILFFFTWKSGCYSLSQMMLL